MVARMCPNAMINTAPMMWFMVNTITPSDGSFECSSPPLCFALATIILVVGPSLQFDRTPLDCRWCRLWLRSMHNPVSGTSPPNTCKHYLHARNRTTPSAKSLDYFRRTVATQPLPNIRRSAIASSICQYYRKRWNSFVQPSTPSAHEMKNKVKRFIGHFQCSCCGQCYRIMTLIVSMSSISAGEFETGPNCIGQIVNLMFESWLR